MNSRSVSVPRRSVLTGLAAIPASVAGAATTGFDPKNAEAMSRFDVRYRTLTVGDVDVFFREAGPADSPVILLLHGFPTSSHMFRNLIPELADRFRVIAPDLPGFGRTKSPPRDRFEYSFDKLAKVIGDFVDHLGVTRYALYVFDYGAPTGFRLAVAHPERVTAIVTQNGNAYVEGFSKDWAPWQTYWREPTPEHREVCRASLTDAEIWRQYSQGAPADRLAPDGALLDMFYMRRPDADEIQLDLILSYRTNVALYPAFQAYFREHQPSLLAVWGKNDPYFLPPGAEAFTRDLPKAEIHFVESGHFALETHHVEIAAYMRNFLTHD